MVRLVKTELQEEELFLGRPSDCRRPSYRTKHARRDPPAPVSSWTENPHRSRSTCRFWCPCDDYTESQSDLLNLLGILRRPAPLCGAFCNSEGSPPSRPSEVIIPDGNLIRYSDQLGKRLRWSSNRSFPSRFLARSALFAESVNVLFAFDERLKAIPTSLFSTIHSDLKFIQKSS